MKNIFKFGKSIAMLVIISFLLTFFVLPTEIEADTDESDWGYEVVDDGVAVTGYYGTSTSLEIPSMLGGRPVTEIGYAAFEGKGTFTGITFPNTLKRIGMAAFRSTGLESGDLVLPDSVECVDIEAFSKFEAPGRLILSSGMEEIISNSFSECRFGGDLVIPNSVRKVESRAFYSSEFDGGLTLSENLNIVEEFAFYFCKVKGDLVIPKRVYHIAEGAFGYSDLDGTLRFEGNYLKTIELNCYENLSFQGGAVIPEGVTMVDGNGIRVHSCDFYFPEGVQTIKDFEIIGWNKCKMYIPSSATEIEDVTMSGSESEKSENITIYGYAGTCAEEWANEVGATFVTLEDGETMYPETSEEPEVESADVWTYELAEDGATITGYSGTKNILEFPETVDGYKVVEIGEGAFEDSEIIDAVILPDGLKRIGDCAFKNTEYWMFLPKLPDTIEYIGKEAFYNSDLNGKLVLPTSLKELGDYCFAGCSFTNQLTLPDTLLYIGKSAFSGCNFSGELTLPRVFKGIGDYAGFERIIKVYGYDREILEKMANYLSIPYELLEENKEEDVVVPTPMPTSVPDATKAPIPTASAKPTFVPNKTPVPSTGATPTSNPTETLNSSTDETTVAQSDVVTQTIEPEPTPKSVKKKISSKKDKKLQKPKIVVSKGRTSLGEKCIRIKLKKYKGKYVEVYVRQKNGKYVKVKLKKNKSHIKKNNSLVKLTYSKGGSTLYCKVRTYKLVKGKKKYSYFSKVKKIRL